MLGVIPASLGSQPTDSEMTMKTFDLRRSLQHAALAAALAITPALVTAQGTGAAGTGTGAGGTGATGGMQSSVEYEEADDDTDMGWLGLLGLAGLLGLRRRNVVNHTDTTTRRP
jgi:MYXO-CTERM domain-containing protein